VTHTFIDDRPTRQKRHTLAEPDAGWSRDAYDQELTVYVAERGRPPQTVTMHPETANVLGLHEGIVDPPVARGEPLVITSRDYAPQTITLYY
jgi:hypothetical protein